MSILARKLQKIWNVWVQVILLDEDSLGIFLKQFQKKLKAIDIIAEIGQQQRTVLLDTTRIFINILAIQDCWL